MNKKPKQTPIDLGFLARQGQGLRTDLSSIFAESVAAEGDMQRAALVRIDRLLNNPYQPRLEAPEDGIEELAGVIRSQGFQGVLVARPDPVNRGFYQLTAGHRRREAARRAGLAALPVVVRDLTDEEMVTLAITENIQREDLTPLEEGRIFLLMAEEMGYTHEQIAREIGRKRGYVENRIRVARAPRDVQALVQAKPDSIRMVANLVKVKDDAERTHLIDGILAGHLTVEDLPGLVEKGVQGRTPDSHRSPAKGVQGSSPDGVAGVSPELPPTALRGDEQRLARIGSARLATVVRYLMAYRQQSTERVEISEKERAALVQIRTLAEELYVAFGRAAEKDTFVPGSAEVLPGLPYQLSLIPDDRNNGDHLPIVAIVGSESGEGEGLQEICLGR